MKTLLIALVAVVLQYGALDTPAPRARQHVAYVAEAQTVPANRRTMLELHFRVDDGFHVNSHEPKSELQIPTKLEMTPAAGVTAAPIEYPAGKLYVPDFDPSTKLDVYSNEFIVRVPVIATPGDHEIKASLTYQACDRAACFPPRTLPVDVIFQAK